MRRLILMMALMLSGPALAQDAGGIGPEIPMATGEAHPQGNDYMRRFHMNMMRHDRDETMYNGDRDVEASLGECFDCHTVRDEAGLPVTADDERHFCRVCHDFAAVRVDCFDCHRSTPEDFDEPAPHALNSPAGNLLTPLEDGNSEMLQAYLDGMTLPETEVTQ